MPTSFLSDIIIKMEKFNYESIGVTPEVLKKENKEMLIQRSVEKLDEILDNEETFLGEGATALVHSLIPGICCKIFRLDKDIPPESFVNTPEDELDIMTKIKNLQHQVHTPKPCYANIIETSKRKYLVMEELKAVSLRDILEGRAKFPKAFDFESFFRDIESFLEKIHNMGVYHRDLHEGNIMIDKKGKPYVIDFGTGVKTFVSDDTPYKIDIGVGDYFNLPNDEGMLRGVREKVRAKHLTKK